MLENIRFNEGEESNDSKFSKKLSNLGDIYRPWRSIAARVFWQYQNISKVVSKVEPQLSNSVRD